MSHYKSKNVKEQCLKFYKLLSCISKFETIEKVIYASSAAVYGNSALKILKILI